MQYKNLIWLGVMGMALIAGCQKKPAAEESKTEMSATATEPSASRPSEGIVSMADAYIEEALSRPLDKLYIEAKASQSNEARFRLGLALLAGRKADTIKDKEFTPAMAEARYWLERAKPVADAKAGAAPAPVATGAKDYTPLTAYVFGIGVECVADLKQSLKDTSRIAIDQAKDSCWGEAAYERYKAELAKNP